MDLGAGLHNLRTVLYSHNFFPVVEHVRGMTVVVMYLGKSVG